MNDSSIVKVTVNGPPVETFETLKGDIANAKAESPDTKTSLAETAIPSKRGRHKRDCDCEKCKARRINVVSPDTPSENPVFDDSTASALVIFAFDVIAERKGEHWKLSETEQKQVSSLTAKVLNKHLGIFAGYAEEVALGTILVVIVFSRIAKDRAIKASSLPTVESVENEPTLFGT